MFLSCLCCSSWCSCLEMYCVTYQVLSVPFSLWHLTHTFTTLLPAVIIISLCFHYWYCVAKLCKQSVHCNTFTGETKCFVSISLSLLSLRCIWGEEGVCWLEHSLLSPAHPLSPPPPLLPLPLPLIHRRGWQQIQTVFYGVVARTLRSGNLHGSSHRPGRSEILEMVQRVPVLFK